MATDELGPLLSQFLTLAEARLTYPVGRATIMPGNTVAWDDCCSGQLWVRIVSIVGVSGLSTQQMQPCLQMYQIRCALGAMRCAHTVMDDGSIPSAAEVAADAFATFQDRADLTQALACDIAPIIEDSGQMQAFKIEDWLPQGPQGGCVGGEIMFTFSHVLCQPCN